MRKVTVIIGGVLLLAAVPAVVLAASGVFGSRLDRQSAKWTTSSATTSNTNWRNVPGLSLTRCTLHQVTANLNVTVSGAPVRFRVIVDGVPEAPMRGGPARFVPNGIESFSYSFVGRTAPFEADDTHSFTVQWRSTTGGPVRLRRGVLNLLYQRGEQGCP
jgi:hypothetical protein